MDAKRVARLEEKERLLARLAELETDELKAEGHFDEVPHMSILELAGERLGKQLGQKVVGRAVAESNAQVESAPCPGCGADCCLVFKERVVEGANGPTSIQEPCGTCKSCRRSFFPSSRSDGDGQSSANA